jgi:hypothetical protein
VNKANSSEPFLASNTSLLFPCGRSPRSQYRSFKSTRTRPDMATQLSFTRAMSESGEYVHDITSVPSAYIFSMGRCYATDCRTDLRVLTALAYDDLEHLTQLNAISLSFASLTPMMEVVLNSLGIWYRPTIALKAWPTPLLVDTLIDERIPSRQTYPCSCLWNYGTTSSSMLEGRI